MAEHQRERESGPTSRLEPLHSTESMMGCLISIEVQSSTASIAIIYFIKLYFSYIYISLFFIMGLMQVLIKQV